MSTHKITILDRELEIEVTSYTPYTPAKLNALPEDCFPAEGPEIEFEISDDNEDVEFLAWLLEDNPKFYSKVEELLYMQIDSDLEPEEQ